MRVSGGKTDTLVSYMERKELKYGNIKGEN